MTQSLLDSSVGVRMQNNLQISTAQSEVVSQWEDNTMAKWNRTKGKRVIYETLHSLSFDESQYNISSNGETFQKTVCVRTTNVFDRKCHCGIRVAQSVWYIKRGNIAKIIFTTNIEL
jgi:hypothetical protein